MLERITSLSAGAIRNTLANVAVSGVAVVLMVNPGCARPAEPGTPPAKQVQIEPATTHITEPLDDKGWPDYLAAFNQQGAAYAGQNNIIDVLRPRVRLNEQRDQMLAHPLDRWWSPPEASPLAAWLLGMDILLDDLLVALQESFDDTAPVRFFNARYRLPRKPPLLGSLPEGTIPPPPPATSTQELRRQAVFSAPRDHRRVPHVIAAHALAHRAIFLAEVGEAERFWPHVLAALQLSAALTHTHDPEIWRRAQQQYAAVWEVVHLGVARVDRADPAGLHAQFQAVPLPRAYRPIVDESERLFALDLAAFLARHPHHLHELDEQYDSPSEALLARLEHADWGAVMRAINRFYDALSDAYESPADQRASQIQQLVQTYASPASLNDDPIEDALTAEILRVLQTRFPSDDTHDQALAAREAGLAALAP